jgi:hypothetical protein
MIHALTQFLIYKWRAKGRHGIHSPFAYSFVEDVLQDRGKIFKKIQVQDRFSWLGPEYGALATRVSICYGYRHIVFIPGDIAAANSNFDMAVVRPGPPAAWQDLVNKSLPFLANGGVIFIPGIHNTSRHTHSWRQLCATPAPCISIDLYGAGLLFFKDDFRQRQHFVLRYSLSFPGVFPVSC